MLFVQCNQAVLSLIISADRMHSQLPADTPKPAQNNQAQRTLDYTDSPCCCRISSAAMGLDWKQIPFADLQNECGGGRTTADSPPTLLLCVHVLNVLLWLNVIREHIKLCHSTFQHRFRSFCCLYLFCRVRRPAERGDKLPCSSHYTFRLFLSPSRLVPPNSCFPWQYK